MAGRGRAASVAWAIYVDRGWQDRTANAAVAVLKPLSSRAGTASA